MAANQPTEVVTTTPGTPFDPASVDGTITISYPKLCEFAERITRGMPDPQMLQKWSAWFIEVRDASSG